MLSLSACRDPPDSCSEAPKLPRMSPPCRRQDVYPLEELSQEGSGDGGSSEGWGRGPDSKQDAKRKPTHLKQLSQNTLKNNGHQAGTRRQELKGTFSGKTGWLERNHTVTDH